MRRVSVDNVREGMVLGKTLYTSDGNILLNSGMKLKESYIKRFKELNIYQLYIEDEISSDIIIKDVISDEVRFEARVAVRKAMDSIKLGESITTKYVRNAVSNIVEELLNSRDVVVNLSDIRSTDDYTFCHSVNVCVLSVLTGISMGYDRDKLYQLGIGAMMHDIGKLRIPNEILNKPSQLTEEEYEVMKKHTNYGYEILKKSDDFSVYSRYVALTHHERIDGSGYPMNMAKEEIHEYSRIVAVTDVYDAMTSDRVYKGCSKISYSVEYLIGMSHHKFDYYIVKKFLEHITIYPVGSIVMLNTGQTGIVVDINKSFPDRPVVRILKDENGNMLKEFKEMDLTKHNYLFINRELEDI